jgi:hypothetical protein
MVQILISTIENKQKSLLTINERELKKVEKLQYLGGFNRFNLSIYDDKPEPKPTDYNYVLSILSIYVFNTDTKELKAALKNL